MNINSIIFNVGDAITVRSNSDIKGIITAILLTDTGIEYKISYWDELDRKQEWLQACELIK